jgi:O-antigen ligase
LVALAALISLVSPSAALGGCLAAAPFIFLPAELGSSSWSHLELMLVASGVGLIGRLAIEVLSTRSLSPVVELMPAPGILIGAVVLVALSGLALTNLADPEHRDASLRAVRTVTIEPLVIVPMTLRVLRRGRIEIALGALACALIAVVAWGFADVIVGSGVAADGVRRAVGPYNHPNNFAFYLERATLLTAIPALLLPKYRRFGYVLLGIGIAGVLSTFSRGALIGLPAGMLVAVWLAGRLKAMAAVLAGAMASLGLFAIFAGDRLLDSGGEGAEPSRITIWEGAERILRDFPLTGIGPDQFFVMYGLRYIEPVGWPERYTSHPHNVLLDFWLTLGIGGLVLAVIAIFWIAWQIVCLRRTQGAEQSPVNHRDVQIAGAATLTAGIVHGFVDNAFFLPDLAVLTWFALILLVPATFRRSP